jgi:inosose dehydratase
MAISIASAPVSWGIMESVEYPPDYPYARVLDEIQKAGYSGTELGPYGFLSPDAAALRGELERRGLALCSAFVAMHLGDDFFHDRGLDQVARTGHLISQVGCRLLILSDEITQERCAAAGRPDEANRLSWTETAWKAAQNAIRKVIALCDELGLRVAFHHHVGTHVETPQEVERLLTLFSPGELGLCLDTGHYVYGGGDPKDLLARHAERVLCAHLKDIDATRLAEARRQGIDFYAAVRHGVFAPLGQGAIDFPGVLAMLRDHRFDGWVVVEQDVLAGGRGATTPLANAMAGRRFLRSLGY